MKRDGMQGVNICLPPCLNVVRRRFTDLILALINEESLLEIDMVTDFRAR